jgi:hypothetical protein
MFIVGQINKRVSSVRSGMCWMHNIPLLTELEVVDERHAINISLLRSYEPSPSYVELTLTYGKRECVHESGYEKEKGIVLMP